MTSMPARPEHPDAPHVPPAESPAPATVAPPQPRRHRRIILAAGLAVIVALVAFGAWRLFFAAPSLPPGIIAVSGRIEGDDSAVSPKTSGRIRELTVREGDHVDAGAMIAVLDDEQVRAREKQAEAMVRQAGRSV